MAADAKALLELRERTGAGVMDCKAALQASEGRYRLLADSGNELIWAMDLDGNLTYISPSVTRLRGRRFVRPVH